MIKLFANIELNCPWIEAWIAACASCGVADLETFAPGLQGDLDAIKAALTSPYSKGSAEEPALISHT